MEVDFEMIHSIGPQSDVYGLEEKQPKEDDNADVHEHIGEELFLHLLATPLRR